jgi:16S rRNA U516 pseudouridylate synthase RsuA-like enzyme
LVRTRIAELTLTGLTIGKWRELTTAEVAQLRKATRPSATGRRLR